MGNRLPTAGCVLLVLAVAFLVVTAASVLLPRTVSEEEMLMVGAIITVVGLGTALLRDNNGDGGGLG